MAARAAREAFGRELYLSMPPMEGSDLKTIQGQLSQLNAFSDSCVTERNAKYVVEEGNSSTSSLAESIRTHISEYHAKKKEKGLSARCNVVDGGDDDETTLTIHTFLETLTNGNTGALIGTYKVSSSSKLKGYVCIHGHYSELGANMHMRSERTLDDATLSAKDEDEAKGKEIVDQIVSWEKEVYQELSAMFDSSVDDGLKKIRRILPITKTRFKWDSAAQTQVKLLNARKTS